MGNLATFEEDRAHFGAWCVVSSPLILGHDLADNETNAKIWPIITNKAAISVSQSFAQGDRMHPGGLVRSGMPPSPPPPPGPAPAVGFLWAGGKDMYKNEWEVPAPGVAGPLKHTPSSLCIDAAANHGSGAQNDQIALQACKAGSATQQFVLDAVTGELHLAQADKKLCIAIKNLNGPGVVWYTCNTGTNEEFTATDGALCSKNGHCLTAKSTSPGGGGGDVEQLWAKPQPNGATAVLLLNNADPSVANITMTFSFQEVGFTVTPSASILDIWTGESKPISGTDFTTDSFGGHDSRFYLLSA